MTFAHGIIALMVVASSSASAATTACPAPPVATSDAAICLAKLHTPSENRTFALKYLTEEHEDYWFVEYWPKDSSVRGGGGKLRIDKATGQVVFVEGYR